MPTDRIAPRAPHRQGFARDCTPSERPCGSNDGDIEVTSPDPFLVGGTERSNAVRVCIGPETTDAACSAARATIAGVCIPRFATHDARHYPFRRCRAGATMRSIA